MNTLPPRTAEQRAEDLAKALVTRQFRAKVKRDVKRGEVTVPDALKMAWQEDMLAGMTVVALLESAPGFGKVRAAQLMERLSIAPNRRLGGLGPNQRAALEDAFTPVAA